MKIAITGTSTGIGKHLAELLKFDHDVIGLPRSVFDLDYPEDFELCELMIQKRLGKKRS